MKLEELFRKYPLQLETEDMVLDLGCGTGLMSFVIARETGAKVYANNLSFDERQFQALVSIDSYHYFAGKIGLSSRTPALSVFM